MLVRRRSLRLHGQAKIVVFLAAVWMQVYGIRGGGDAPRCMEQGQRDHHHQSSQTITYKQGEEETTEKYEVRPIPSESDRILLREAYEKAKGSNSSPQHYYDSHDAHVAKRIAQHGLSGFLVPIEVRISPGKGRGVFVTEFVKKATKVWDDRNGHFYNEHEFRTFLSYLPYEMKRDVVTWCNVRERNGRQFVVTVEMDEAALINHGGSAFNHNGVVLESNHDDDTANIVEDGDGGLRASRDIQPGEELLFDYEILDTEYDLPWLVDIWYEYAWN